jgi:hypothetical protein
MSEIREKTRTIRKELDKITAKIGSTETMIINELFDKLLEVAEAEIKKYKQFRDDAVAKLWKIVEEKEKLEGGQKKAEK